GTVPPSRRDEVGMRETRVCVRESDNARQDAAARVRGERDDEVAEQVLGRLRAVESAEAVEPLEQVVDEPCHADQVFPARARDDRKSTRLNSSHQIISYAVFCLRTKK